jgi:hypothetical protein
VPEDEHSAPDAILTQSNPKSVTVVAHGLTEITAWYQGFQTKFPGMQFTQEGMRSLAPHVVLSYEHALPPGWVSLGPLHACVRAQRREDRQHGLGDLLRWPTSIGAVRRKVIPTTI